MSGAVALEAVSAAARCCRRGQGSATWPAAGAPERAAAATHQHPREGPVGGHWGAWGMAAEALTDAVPPPAPGATPREVGSWPRVTTMAVPGRDIAPRAAGCRWWGSDPSGDAGVRVVEGPGVQVERDGVGPSMCQRCSPRQRGASAHASRESSIKIHLDQPRGRPHHNSPRS
jgi:hypothetical protein